MSVVTGPYRIKQGTVGRPFRVTLVDGRRQPIDLTDIATVKLVMRLRGATTPTVDAVALVLQSGIVNKGRVEYTWLPGDTDIAGIYDLEFLLTYTGGSKDRVPSGGYFEVQILGDLG